MIHGLGDLGSMMGDYQMGAVGVTSHGDRVVDRQPTGLDEKRESKSSGRGSKEAKGNDDSSKMTCREINRWFMVRSRHWYPL
jgi:hypothetical protein